LTDRKQRVVLNGQESDINEVTSGVIQGSVLGPVLALMMLDSIDEELKHSSASKYADDNKIYGIVNDIADQANLQSDLDRIGAWANRWGFDLNAEKCSVLQFGPGQKWSFSINGQPLRQSRGERDLGVMIRPDLRWDDQVRSATQRARVAAHSITNSFISKDVKVWSSLFRTFVRPHTEYAMPAWLPHQANHLKMLESVQRWFTCQVPGIGKMDHLTRYQICDLQPIEVRRDRGILIETYKIISGHSATGNGLLREHFHEYGTRGRTNGNLAHIKPSGNVRKYTFAAMAPVLWDAVPPEARNATSVNSFKNLLDSTTFGREL